MGVIKTIPPSASSSFSLHIWNRKHLGGNQLHRVHVVCLRPSAGSLAEQSFKCQSFSLLSHVLCSKLLCLTCSVCSTLLLYQRKNNVDQKQILAEMPAVTYFGSFYAVAAEPSWSSFQEINLVSCWFFSDRNIILTLNGIFSVGLCCIYVFFLQPG